MSVISHWLNRSLEVWRPSTTGDGAGGTEVTYVQQPDPVMAKVDQSSMAERERANQWGAEHTHSIYLEPDADVLRGDELRGDGQVFRVLGWVSPSSERYRKAASSERVQPEGS